MRDIRFSFEHSPVLWDFYRDFKHRTIGVMGPFGSGKSSVCLMKLLAAADQQPVQSDGKKRSRFAVIRNTYRQLEDTTIRTVFDWLPEGDFGTYVKSDHIYLINGLAPDLEIELLFRALDRPEHISNLLSIEYTGAWVNEGREVPWEVIKVLGRRVGRYPAPRDGGCWWAGIILDSNPPDHDSDWYRFFEQERPASAALYKQPGGMSPQAENKPNLPSDYYTSMADDMSEEELRVYRDGEYGYITTGRPVYAEYRDSLHSSTQKVTDRPIWRGWDFGLTPACVFVQTDANGRLHIIDELCAERAGIERFGALVMQHCAEVYPKHRFHDVGDPAGDVPGQTDERTCFEILAGLGADPVLGIQDPTLRQESVRYALGRLIDGEPGLQIDPKCGVLRRGFMGGYQYRRMVSSTAGPRFEQRPYKNMYSHPHDALQYVAVELLGDLVQGNRPSDHKRLQRVAHDLDPFEGDPFEPSERLQAYAEGDYDVFDRGGHGRLDEYGLQREAL